MKLSSIKYLNFLLKGSFQPFENISKLILIIDAMIISFGLLYKWNIKVVKKRIRVENIGQTRKEYNQLLERGWNEISIYSSYL